jgi:hypothetical protein
MDDVLEAKREIRDGDSLTFRKTDVLWTYPIRSPLGRSRNLLMMNSERG